MPTYEAGNMWSIYDQTDEFIITTNAITTRRGKLVMGRGIAKEARDRFPGLDEELARVVIAEGPEYGFVSLPLLDVSIFQVKHHWKDKADPWLIEKSVNMLTEHAKANPEMRFDINYPGIGNGGLAKWIIENQIDLLPDNVHVWELW